MTLHTQTFAGLPACLAHLAAEKRWLVWKWETRTDKQGIAKPTKPPRQPHGAMAASNDPATWATLANALAAVESGRFEGIGLALLDLPCFGALDLDDVRNPETGEVLPWAAEVIACGSYAELTPSGTGFRVLGIVAADHAMMHGKKKHPEGGEIEFYINIDAGHARYITVSGARVGGGPGCPASP